MTTWDEIRDEVAGMLADGESLENIIPKLEQMKNEMAKANLLKAMDEMKNPLSLTNEEWFCSLSTEEKADALTHKIMDIICWNNDPKPSEVYITIKNWLKREHE